MYCFKYLGSQVAADGECERDVVRRMTEGYTAWGGLKSVPSIRGLGIKAKNGLYEGVIIPTALYHRVDSVVESSLGSKIMHLFISDETFVRWH